MPKLTMEATRGVMYNILEEFATFCDAHGLRYYLAYGTCIGAIRHKGFIPWDHDIDVLMPVRDAWALIRYQKEFGERISEMKLHKLLYFTQRESLIQLGEPMFGENR